MKIFRNNVGVDLTLEEFITLLGDEDRIDEISELLFDLEEDGDALAETKDLDDDLDFYESEGTVGLMKAPAPVPAINQYFIQLPPSGLKDADYLDEVGQLENDELKKIRRILERFSSFLD